MNVSETTEFDASKYLKDENVLSKLNCPTAHDNTDRSSCASFTRTSASARILGCVARCGG